MISVMQRSNFTSRLGQTLLRTLGGMIGNDSYGTHSVMAGKTVDNIEALEILTYDGLRM